MEEKQKIEEQRRDIEHKLGGVIHAVFEYNKRQIVINWIKEHPQYWEYIYSSSKDLSKDIALKVSRSLKKYGILELEVLWIMKCQTILDISGELADE